MNYYTYSQIRNQIKSWISNNAVSWKEMGIDTTISKESTTSLILDFTFINSIAQLIICEEDFAPYNMVSYEAIALNKKIIEEDLPYELVYFYYDSQKSSLEFTFSKLEQAIKYCSNFTYKFLEEKYIGKCGTIDLIDNINFFVYSEDIEIFKTLHQKGNIYTCTGVFAQYLILEYEKISFKIEYEFFTLL